MILGKYVEALETVCMAGEFKCYSGLGETVQFLKRLNGMAMDLAAFLVIYSAVSACSQKHTISFYSRIGHNNQKLEII